MSGSVVVLSEFVARRRATPAGVMLVADAARARCGTRADENSASPADFCFWQGASGERYVHHVYSLVNCPQFSAANYVLFGRDENGRRKVLRVGRTVHETGSLNLAEIRHRGAKLGATEVHVHTLAGSDAERRQVEMDLHAGLYFDPDSRPMTA
jgi:hypothetical protein